MSTSSAGPSRGPLSLTAFLAAHPAVQPAKAVLPALYADLDSQKSSNPHAFASSVDTWHTLLADAALLGVQLADGSAGAQADRLVLHADAALQAHWILRGLGRPLGLGTVIAELASDRHLIQLGDFLGATQSLHSPIASSSASASAAPTFARLALQVLGAPFWWSLSQLGLGGGGSSADDDDYGGVGSHGEGTPFWKKHVQGDWVLWRNLDRVTAAVLEAHYSSAASPIDHLYSPELVRTVLLPRVQRILEQSRAGPLSSASEVATPALSELDVRIVLKHLCRDQKLALMDSAQQVIKFAPSQHAPGSIEKISESDRGIVQVRDARARLERQVSEVEARIADRDARIRTALRAQPKQMAQAKSYLASKKALEELLKRRLGALETMSSVVLKLEQASGDIEIMQAYNTSTTTLKALLSHPSLNIDKVEDTMAALSDALADHAEVDDTIRATGEGIVGQGPGGEIDEVELERELAALEEESAREKQVAAAAAAAKPEAVSNTGVDGAAGQASVLPSAPSTLVADEVRRPAGAEGSTSTPRTAMAQAE